MNADDQHFLIIGAVEDADPAAFRQVAAGSPEKIVLQFRDTRMLASLRTPTEARDRRS